MGHDFQNSLRNIHKQHKLCPNHQFSHSLPHCSPLWLPSRSHVPVLPQTPLIQQLSSLVSSRPGAVIGILWICLHSSDKIVSTLRQQATAPSPPLSESQVQPRPREGNPWPRNQTLWYPSLLHLQSLIFAESDNGYFYADTKTAQFDRDHAFNSSARDSLKPSLAGQGLQCVSRAASPLGPGLFVLTPHICLDSAGARPCSPHMSLM